MGLSPTHYRVIGAVVCVYLFVQRDLCIHFYIYRDLCIHFYIYEYISFVLLYIILFWKLVFFYSMVTYSLDFLDEELGIYKPKQKPNWITKFRNTNMVKWFILQIKLISKRLIHFPLILIFSLLCSSAYPNILSAINSLIISLLITFVICSKGFLYSLCFRKNKE